MADAGAATLTVPTTGRASTRSGAAAVPALLGRRRGGGSGLGLAICREIVDALGGGIALDERPAAEGRAVRPRRARGAAPGENRAHERAPAPTVRLDKWLWAARFYKTRGLAADEIGKGRVAVNGQPAKPARELHIGDSDLRQGTVPRTVLVLGLSDVRGPAPVAQALYEETAESVAQRKSSPNSAARASSRRRATTGAPDQARPPPPRRLAALERVDRRRAGALTAPHRPVPAPRTGRYASTKVPCSAGTMTSSSSQSSDQPTTVWRMPGGCTQHAPSRIVCTPWPSKSVANQPFST